MNIKPTSHERDVDIDFLPISRDAVKTYAAEKYGQEYVCSVGLYQKYHPKLALADAARALGKNAVKVISITRDLPESFDTMPFEEAYTDDECTTFKEYADEYPEVVNLAYRMVNLIKTQGKHAGGLIISSEPVKNYIPMTLLGKGDTKQWTSAWTEGRDAQLSKFGFVKFDILGLKTLQYIWMCTEMIREKLNIDINFTDIDPEDDRCGWMERTQPNGMPDMEKITLSDKKALNLACDLKTETIFQFETPLAKSILQKGGVQSFNDLVIYSALGRPGPLPMIGTYITNRDGYNWKKGEHPEIIKILEKTHGILTYQEQLAEMWTKLAGFTVPEAEAARKAVAKKWEDKLVDIGKKWISGSTPILGEQLAEEWWEKMKTFGRYAFNVSHVTSYILISYQSLWLKAYFPAYWWASAMSICHTDKLSKYMGICKNEGILFGSLDCDSLSRDFTVVDDTIIPGISLIKKIGKQADSFTGKSAKTYKSFDDFLKRATTNKTVIERMVRLGAFDKKHKNRKAIMTWYQYQFDKSKNGTQLRKQLRAKFAWSMKDIQAERERQKKEFKNFHPNRKLPNKFNNWIPTTPANLVNKTFGNLGYQTEEDFHKYSRKIALTLADISQIIKNDYTLKELLEFEKEYLGYYIHNPMDLFEIDGYTIQEAKEEEILECLITKVEIRTVNTTFADLTVTDGLETASLKVWSNERALNEDYLKEGMGIRALVRWNDKYNSFNIHNKSIILPLAIKGDMGNYEGI